VIPRTVLTATLLIAFLRVSCAQAPAAQAHTTTSTYEKQPEFIKARAEAMRMSRTSGQAIFAANAWKKANKIAGGRCMECFTGIIDTSLATGDIKAAAQSAREMEAAADTPHDKAVAEIQLGRILLGSPDGKKPNIKALEEAHEALVRSEQFTTAAYFLDGRVLAGLNRDQDAAVAFRKFAADPAQDASNRARALRFAEHPEFARMRSAPTVAVDTLNGKHFDLENMTGKVILIDFWATWCGPCKEELPRLKKLAQQFQSEPFEILSISWDADETKWKDFIAANGMTWNHYRDADHSLTSRFGINAIPHYFTIDGNGVLTGEVLGSDSNIEGRIKKMLQQAKEQRQRLSTTAAPSASGLQ
jgi:thiol-disulfide isomerase/thioredoxin